MKIRVSLVVSPKTKKIWQAPRTFPVSFIKPTGVGFVDRTTDPTFNYLFGTVADISYLSTPDSRGNQEIRIADNQNKDVRVRITEWRE